MQQISLREANQHLAHYIAIVEKGDEVIITRRGEPVARLLPTQKNVHCPMNNKHGSACLNKCTRDLVWEEKSLIEKTHMSVERITLDTNILVYDFDKDAGKNSA